MNNRGVSLLQVLIFGSFMSTLSMFVLKKTNILNKAIRTTFFSEEIYMVVHAMEMTLADARSCTRVFGGVDFAVHTDQSSRENQIVSNLSDKLSFFEPGQKLGPQDKYTLTSLDLYKSPNFATTNELIFEMNFEVEDKGSIYGGGEVSRKIPIVAIMSSERVDECYFDPEGKIREFLAKFCQGDAHTIQNGAKCVVRGFDFAGFNPSAPNSGLSNVCGTGQVANGINKTGDVYTYNCVPNTYWLPGRRCSGSTYLDQFPQNTSNFQNFCRTVAGDVNDDRLLPVLVSGSGCTGFGYTMKGKNLEITCM